MTQRTPSGEAAASGPLRVNAQILIPAEELAWRFSRSSGPGGQGVNTADSRVELVFDLAGSGALPAELKARAVAKLGARAADGRITVAASEFRSQLRNRQAARARLAALLAEAVAAPPRKRRATKPSKGAVARRLDEKARRSRLKQSRRLPPD
jgi:ribosome-associated protein